MTRSQTSTPETTQRGVTLAHCLLLLVIALMLGTASFRMVHEGHIRTIQSHWGRAAEALADGALAMAVDHLNAGKGEAELSAKLSTGIASAWISVPENHPEERLVVFEGVAATPTKVRATRRYEASLGSTDGKSWSVWSVRRL